MSTIPKTSPTYPRTAGMTAADMRYLLDAGALLVSGKRYADCDFAEQVAAQNITCIEAAEVEQVTA